MFILYRVDIGYLCNCKYVVCRIYRVDIEYLVWMDIWRSECRVVASEDSRRSRSTCLWLVDQCVCGSVWFNLVVRLKRWWLIW
mmetsp:Transcript_923/g.1841  ORF Transcript_923/g.1841 Transcript_923/m.1841 type:complete len:83 (-) Transcript_923:596-844(-)